MGAQILLNASYATLKIAIVNKRTLWLVARARWLRPIFMTASHLNRMKTVPHPLGLSIY